VAKKANTRFSRAKVTESSVQPPTARSGIYPATVPRQATETEIAERAYYRYLDRAGRQGDALNDWIEAERALRAERDISP
jgi:hypothetical protein